MRYDILRNFARAAMGAIAFMLARFFYDTGSAWLGTPAAVILGLGAFAAILAVLLIVSPQLSRQTWYRKLFFKNARFEGYWFQRVYNDRPYSLSQIRYDDDKGLWVYSGKAYSLDRESDTLTLGAEWRSRSIHYDDETDRWFFFGDAWLVSGQTGLPANRIGKGEVSTTIDFKSPRQGAYGATLTDDVPMPNTTNLNAFYARLFHLEGVETMGDVVLPDRIDDMTDEDRQAVLRECIKRYARQLRDSDGDGT